MTKPFSDKILNMAQADLTMRVRLARVNDLIDADGLHHLPGWVNFKCRAEKAKEGNHGSIIETPDKLCLQFRMDRHDGYVYVMGNVWCIFQKMRAKDCVELPQKYLSRRTFMKMSEMS